MISQTYSVFDQRIYRTVFLLTVLFLGTLRAQATDYQRKLIWGASKTYTTIDNKAITQPTFTNSKPLEKYDLLPTYAETFPTAVSGDVTAQVVNPVYSATTGLDANSAKYIKADPIVDASLMVYRKIPSAFVQILPFRKNPITGAIEKLESFTIRVNINPRAQSRGANSFAASSVLASGNWYKVDVSTEGIYKIDYNYIKKTLHVDPSTVNISSLAIFGNGGGMVPEQNSATRADDLLENPTMVVDVNGNNKFDTDDYLLFYAQMPDAWQFNAANQTFTHTKNLYTDKTFYFLTTTSGTGKRVPTVAAASNPNHTITDFNERFYHESEEVNLLQSGRIWLGDKMTTYGNSKTFFVSVNNVLTTSPVVLTSSVAASTLLGSNSTVAVQINNATVLTHHDPGTNPANQYPQAANPLIDTAHYAAAQNTNGFNIVYTFTDNNDPNATAAAYIDYFELNYKSALAFSGNSMTFRNISSVGAGNVSQFNIDNAPSSALVWDITNISSIQQMQSTYNGSQLSFTTPTDALKEFITFIPDPSSFSNPEFVAQVDNQNLHSLGQPNMIIVAYDDFVAPANDLADFHRQYDKLTVNVVKLSQVYNEFGSGKPDIAAIRDLVRMLYVRAQNDSAKMPRYLLLMGDGSFDAKGRIPNNDNFINTYQSYESYDQTNTFTSDDFFGLLDDNEGGDISGGSQGVDVGIGRIPVAAESEGWDVVNKIKNYKRPPQNCTTCVQVNSNQSWLNNITFVADDEDQDIHLDACDALAESTRASHPVYNYDKIYLDAYKQVSSAAGDRYPDVNTAILNKINSGTLVINWVGHGGPENWALERVFNINDITVLQNGIKLPLFITATCDFSAYDLPTRTAGEWLIVNGKGGGIGAITTVRLVYSNANAQLDSEAFLALFPNSGNKFPRLGEAMISTKNNSLSGGVVNDRKFTLLGDPALMLNYPHYNIVTTQVDNKPVALPHDTLKALSKITIKGELRDDNGNRLNSFNGTIYPNVYDKISTLHTLGNDATSPVRSFLEYTNILFKGKASVVNGEYSFTFVVPKDINYQYGSGRVSYYSDNGNYTDANGYSTDIVIGGSADSAAIDRTGPQMAVYMNDEKFVFGGTTNANPVLLVNLQDQSGINTSGNGLGHDITAVLDNNSQNTIILNDYYESALDNYQKGTVKYPLSNLADGKHSIRVKAWDIYNNSTEEYTEFIVTSNAKLALNHVYNYPNPFTTHTDFMFEHNRPFDNLHVMIQIYTVSGKLVKSIVQQVESVGYRVDNIEWDGLDDYGDPIGKGVYIYKLNVRDSSGNTANKFEKLVVLR